MLLCQDCSALHAIVRFNCVVCCHARAPSVSLAEFQVFLQFFVSNNATDRAPSVDISELYPETPLNSYSNLLENLISYQPKY